MVASMTGFARQSFQASWGSLVWELKTVNHRFLEISLKLPEGLRSIEMKARQCIQKHLNRGKVEAYLKFTPGDEVPFELVLNESLLKQLANSSTIIQKYFPGSTINQTDLLQWPGVMDVKQTNMEEVAEKALQLLEESLQELVVSRQREGESLSTFIQERLSRIRHYVSDIETKLPTIGQQMQEKVLKRFNELSLEVDKDRLEQEMVWLLQKMDVAEELQRLTSHVKEMARLLQEKGVAGRRLDFLTQELNREANTIGSKSTDGGVTQSAVELKVQIEQIREQVQNIE